MPLDALGRAPSRFSADAGAAHGISVEARHDTSADMTIPGDFEPCRKTLPLLPLDAAPEAASTISAKSCQTIDVATRLGALLNLRGARCVARRCPPPKRAFNCLTNVAGS